MSDQERPPRSQAIQLRERIVLALLSPILCVGLAVLCIILALLCLMMVIPAPLLALLGRVRKVQNADGSWSYSTPPTPLTR